MRELWVGLERVEREILATAVDDAPRLEALMSERGGFLLAVCERIANGALPEAERAEGYDRLLAHYAAGQALGDRLRQERGRAVEAWGESSRERQLLHLLEATRSAGAPVLVEVG